MYRLVDRHLAMSVGGRSDPGQLRGTDWRALAGTIGVRPAYLVDLVREMAEALPGSLGRVRTTMGTLSASPAVQMIGKALRKQARRTRALLEE